MIGVAEVPPHRLRRPGAGTEGGSPMQPKSTAGFWSKVDKSADCWLWKGSRLPSGYGRLRHGTYAHRVSWALVNGPIPDGMYVLHHCDNPPCVRPVHLFIGTAADNSRDAVSKDRVARADRHGSRHFPAKFPGYPQHGERNGRAKLTEADVREARYRMAAGETVMEIARRLGMGWSATKDMLIRRTWAHVQ